MSTINPNQTLLQSKNQSSPDLTPAPLTGPSQYVRYTTQQVQPPTRVYVTIDDQLFLQVFNTTPNQVLSLRLRMLAADGSIGETASDFALTSANAVNVFTVSVREGFLLGADLSVNLQNNTVGYTFANLSVQRTGPTPTSLYQTLLQGYVNNVGNLSYPESIPQQMHWNRGQFRSIVGATPAAGADINDAVPFGRLWRLLSWRATLTTAVAVSTRIVHMDIRPHGTITLSRTASATQLASLTVNYNAGDMGAENAIDPAEAYILIPPDAYFSNGSIRTRTTGIQPADQWTAASFEVEEWCYLI